RPGIAPGLGLRRTLSAPQAALRAGSSTEIIMTLATATHPRSGTPRRAKEEPVERLRRGGDLIDGGTHVDRARRAGRQLGSDSTDVPEVPGGAGYPIKALLLM